MKSYIKPTITNMDHLLMNEAIAACHIEWDWRWQSLGTAIGPSSPDDPNYAYASIYAAYDSRFGNVSDPDHRYYYGGTFEPIGPIHRIKTDDSHYYFWEDYNANRSWDHNYQWYADPQFTYGLVPAEDMGPHVCSDNLQCVAGDNIVGFDSLIGPNGQIVGS